MADVPAPRADGERVAPGYRLLSVLDEGESVVVYDAWSEERDCRCVVKVLRRDHTGERGARERLLREGRILLGLSHPHIVRAYELVAGPTPALVLETVTGATLSYLIATRARRLPVYDVTHLGLQLCSAIGYLHRRGYVHLDLKPSNIIIECQRAKVIDLGIAQPPGRGRRGVGTAAYMAPEQARGDMVAAATDVWGLGAVLFESLTGRRPFSDADGLIEYPQLTRRPPALRDLRRAPAPLGYLVDHCLSPAGADRPTVAELAAGLRALAGS